MWLLYSHFICIPKNQTFEPGVTNITSCFGHSLNRWDLLQYFQGLQLQSNNNRRFNIDDCVFLTTEHLSSWLDKLLAENNHSSPNVQQDLQTARQAISHSQEYYIGYQNSFFLP